MESSDLRTTLPNNCQYIIVESNFTSEEKFSCVLRIKINNDEEFFKWLRTFEYVTNTNWNLRRSIAPSNKFLFSRDYVCHHSAYNKKAQDANSRRSKNKECGAQLTVRIKYNTKDVRYKDKYVKDGYLGIINISFVHSHIVNNAESWHWLKRAPELKTVFLEYFNKGLSPSASRMYHEDKLLSETPYTIANSQQNPPKHWVYQLHNKWLLQNFGGVKGESFLSVARKNADLYVEQGCKILICEDPVSIVFMTPLMIRQLDVLDYSSVFIDTTASCDQVNTALTLILVATKAGAIPVACALHENQTEQNYVKVFMMLLELWGGYTTVKKIVNFMTDDSRALKNALHSVFPSVRQLICHFHLLQALWRWLSNGKNNILLNHRTHLMNLFKNVVHASNIEEMNLKINEISCDQIVRLYPNYLSHVNKVFERSQEICMALRADVYNNKNNTNNFAEATFRILKDIMLKRLKAYNAVALLDFLINRIDKYYAKKILDVVFGRNTKPFLLHEKIFEKAQIFIKNDLIKEKDGFFIVQSEKNESIWYEVDIGFCSCMSAIQGAFCKHQCAVHVKYNLNFPNAPELCLADKRKLFAVATDNSYSCPESFLKGMMEPCNSTNNSSTNNQLDTEMVAVNEEQHPVSLTIETALQQEASADKKDLFNNFQTEFERIRTMLEKNENDDSLMNVAGRYLKQIKKIQTPAQLHSFFTNSILSRRTTFGSKIRVQPTSLSRRKNASVGSLHSRVGRPRLGVTKSIKPTHLLSSNIKLNSHSVTSPSEAH